VMLKFFIFFKLMLASWLPPNKKQEYLGKKK